MPYMQRITWSGSALHEGVLPGYPASHGCVRLTSSFAQLLWKATKLGARIIVTRPDVAPLEFDHARLFVPRPKMVEAPTASTDNVKTADAGDMTARAPAVPAPIIVDERPKTMPAAMVLQASRRPISIFASLKEGKLYVRQGWKPLFEAPISFERPDQPVGTHVYTAMGLKADGEALRWTVVSIPSGSRPVAELSDQGRKLGRDRAARAMETETPPGASVALDRIVMPQELVERISALVTPGASLIVSDNKLSDETGEYTDFIVLTK
jgi:hypothetical protein